MIKPRNSNKIYATRIDISAEMEYHFPNIHKILKRKSIGELKLPKNTLKVIFKDKKTGFDGDGFVRNVKTVIFRYNIITFKR